MILFRYNLLRGSFPEVLGFDWFVNIVQGCREDGDLSSFNLLQEGSPIQHNYISSKRVLVFEYPPSRASFLHRLVPVDLRRLPGP
jgi:hypothetical protein